MVVFLLVLDLSCSNDSDTSTVNIRIENRDEVSIIKVIIDNNTYINIAPDAFSEYQFFKNSDNFPPGIFAIESEELSRGFVLDYARGTRIENGCYTYVTGFTEDGSVISSLEED